MKKILLSLIVFIFCLIPTTTVAFADEVDTPPTTDSYYIVTNQKLFFYQKSDDGINMNAKFELPVTYFVKNLNDTFEDPVENKLYSYVEYAGIKGYILSSDTKKYTSITDNATLNKLNKDTAYLKETLKPKEEFTLDGVTYTTQSELTLIATKFDSFVFLGENNALLTIPKSHFDEYVIPNHSFPQDNNSNVTSKEESESPYNKLATNLVTIGIAVACVVMVIIMYFPRKKQLSRNDYDDNYYDNYKSRYDARNNR